MKKKYLTLAIASGMIFTTSSALAADVVNYTTPDVVVTATRTHKKDVNIPAATEVVTAKDIHDSGAKNAIDAIKLVNGIQYDSIGSANQNMGTMSNDVIIRGFKDGTLIMVNGVPVSYRGKYDLSAISADAIERIEVIKSGGSVLYGSEAMGGVVNIITKMGDEGNSVSVGIGNRDAHQYSVNVGEENWRIIYSKNVINKKYDVSTPATSSGAELRYFNRDLSKENLNISFSASDKLDFMYNYSESIGYYDRYITDILSGYKGKASVGELYQIRRYDTLNHNMQVMFHDKNWKVTAFNNINFIESKGFTDKFTHAGTIYHTREHNSTYGLDAQNTWNLSKKAALTTGINYKRESYDSYLTETTTTRSNYDRNNWAVFAQLDQKLDAKNSFILGGRETWTSAAYKNQNYNNFSLSGSWLHTMNKENNLYATVAQSFIMPTFSQMYKTTDMAAGNPDLKPQTGINYEIGWKQNHGKHTWKAALFHMDVKDNITATWDASDPLNKYYQYNNVDFRNTGVELSCKIKANKTWTYNYGITYQHPQSKSDVAKKGDMMGKWENVYGRLQLDGGVTFKHKKFTTNLNLSYQCGRYQSQSAANQPVKPYLLSTLNLIYAPDKKSEVNLLIENLLDRRDRVSNSSSDYYCLPTTFMLNYTYKF